MTGPVLTLGDVVALNRWGVIPNDVMRLLERRGYERVPLRCWCGFGPTDHIPDGHQPVDCGTTRLPHLLGLGQEPVQHDREAHRRGIDPYCLRCRIEDWRVKQDEAHRDGVWFIDPSPTDGWMASTTWPGPAYVGETPEAAAVGLADVLVRLEEPGRPVTREVEFDEAVLRFAEREARGKAGTRVFDAWINWLCLAALDDSPGGS